MANMCILVAESARARLFASDGRRSSLSEVEDLTHSESRLQASELTSDLPGRVFDSAGQGRHAMEEAVDPKRREAEAFAKLLADRLESSRRAGEFERLVLVAAPRFLGMLRGNLSDPTRDCIAREVSKNLVREDIETIREAVFARD